jgi:pimeloyl-ACP methyl ester carboxylesterase
MSAIVIDGVVVHYESWGRGPPLILLHGWIGSWRYWMQTMEAMSTDYRSYAIDLVGFGDSAKVKSRYNMVSYVRLLNDFMDQMGIEQASCIGHSLGGAAALIYAARRPERIVRLVTVSMPLQPTAISGRLRSFSNTLVSQLLWRQDGSWAKRLTSLAKAEYPEVSNEAVKTDPDAISESMRSLAAIDLVQELARIHVPKLAVFGRGDPLIDASQAFETEAKQPLSRAIVMEKSRHFPMLEEAVAFHRLLRDFLVDAEELGNLEIKEMWHRRTR